MDNTPQIAAKDFDAWLSWLEENHTTTERIWLIIAKKKSKTESIAMEEAIAGALCYGWVDSRKKGIDDETYMVYFTPRKPNSKWSLANKMLVGILQEKQLMAPAGLASIDLAKARGNY